ncbi:hypothetical protein Scel_74300 [Streptomyces cellostaticus]|nr:hypothetical protein Scel_74300 [Streptomyces cellostaticus]
MQGARMPRKRPSAGTDADGGGALRRGAKAEETPLDGLTPMAEVPCGRARTPRKRPSTG